MDSEVSLKTDIGVNVEIIVNEYKDEIIVPSEFIFQNPARIVLDDGGKAKVLLLERFESAQGYYVLLDTNIDEFIGKNIVAVDLEDGKTIN